MLHHLHPRPHTHEAQNLRFSTLKNHDKESTMQRRLLTLLCLGLLSTAGCYYDPAYGPPSVSVGVGAYTVEHDYWYYHLSSAKMWSAVTQVVLRDRNHSANGPNRKQLSRDDTLLPISHPRGVQIRL